MQCLRGLRRGARMPLAPPGRLQACLLVPLQCIIHGGRAQSSTAVDTQNNTVDAHARLQHPHTHPLSPPTHPPTCSHFLLQLSGPLLCICRPLPHRLQLPPQGLCCCLLRRARGPQVRTRPLYRRQRLAGDVEQPVQLGLTGILLAPQRSLLCAGAALRAAASRAGPGAVAGTPSVREWSGARAPVGLASWDPDSSSRQAHLDGQQRALKGLAWK